MLSIPFYVFVNIEFVFVWALSFGQFERGVFEEIPFMKNCRLTLIVGKNPTWGRQKQNSFILWNGLALEWLPARS